MPGALQETWHRAFLSYRKLRFHTIRNALRGSHAKNAVPGAACIRAVRYRVRFHRETDRKVYTHVDENFGQITSKLDFYRTSDHFDADAADHGFVFRFRYRCTDNCDDQLLQSGVGSGHQPGRAALYDGICHQQCHFCRWYRCSCNV